MAGTTKYATTKSTIIKAIPIKQLSVHALALLSALRAICSTKCSTPKPRAMLIIIKNINNKFLSMHITPYTMTLTPEEATVNKQNAWRTFSIIRFKTAIIIKTLMEVYYYGCCA